MSDEPMLGAAGVDPQNRGRRQGNPCCCIATVIALLLLLVAAVIILVVLLLVVGGQPARVTTTCGPVEGKFDALHKVYVFKGIPFAAPPTGKRRWQPPEPLHKQNGSNGTCWNGVYHADNYPAQCAQYETGTGVYSGSEDCLYLNIFSPSVDPMAPLPVMVYIHGGYLQFGNGSIVGYAPDEKLTSELNMVMISIQYRLAAFGFLVTSALPNGKGNYGYWDQLEALRWIKENVHAFGGDPEKIHIYGQSSGGTSVFSLMTMPRAKGLFQSAWMISPSPIFNKSIADSISETDEWFLQNKQLRTHCPQMKGECLLNLSVSTVAQSVYPQWDIFKDACDLPLKGYFEPALPVIDGDLFPKAPFEMWEAHSGDYSDVPVVIGTTAQEVDLDPAPGLDLLNWDQQDLDDYTARLLDQFGGNITNQSRALYPFERDAQYVFTTMTSDIRVNCGCDRLAREAAQGLKSNVYRYVVTSFPSKPVHPLGMPFPSKYAFHMWDSFGFFDSIGQLFFDDSPSNSDLAFGKTVRENIAHFVKTGVPSDPNWQPYPNRTALLNATLTTTAAYHKDQCDFWLDNGFFGYSWIN